MTFWARWILCTPLGAKLVVSSNAINQCLLGLWAGKLENATSSPIQTRVWYAQFDAVLENEARSRLAISNIEVKSSCRGEDAVEFKRASGTSSKFSKSCINRVRTVHERYAGRLARTRLRTVISSTAHANTVSSRVFVCLQHICFAVSISIVRSSEYCPPSRMSRQSTAVVETPSLLSLLFLVSRARSSRCATAATL